MQTIGVDRVVPYSPSIVWECLSDLSHFGTEDPFHHRQVFTSVERAGAGVRFVLEHSYIPIYPFRRDLVYCEVTAWEPLRRVSIVEKNPTSKYRSHTQSFELIPEDDHTRVSFVITFRGVPWILLPLRLWSYWHIRRRMRQKLEWIHRTCGTLAFYRKHRNRWPKID